MRVDEEETGGVAENFDPIANINDESCEYLGCTDLDYLEYDANANVDAVADVDADVGADVDVDEGVDDVGSDADADVV